MNQSKTYLGINVDYRLISGELLVHCNETDVDKTQWWFQRQIYDNVDILSDNCVISVPFSAKGEMIFHLPDLNELLRCILYKNFIPIELIKIVDTYYGDYASVEHFMYLILAKLLYKLNSNVPGYRQLPFANSKPSVFTSWLYYMYPIYIRHAVTKDTIKFMTFFSNISPTLFYKYYKEVNNLGDDFQVPLSESGSVEYKLMAPQPRHLQPIGYNFFTEPVFGNINYMI